MPPSLVYSPLGVLAHDEEVDFAGLAPGQRAGHALEEPHRAQVDVLVELAAELEQRAPQRDVVGHGGRPAHGTEEQRVHGLQLRLPVVRHHRAGLPVPVAAGPFDGRELERDAEASRGGFEGAQPFGHHFLADAVAGDDGDLVGLAWHVDLR
jgi:hypothetical protein